MLGQDVKSQCWKTYTKQVKAHTGRYFIIQKYFSFSELNLLMHEEAGKRFQKLKGPMICLLTTKRETSWGKINNNRNEEGIFVTEYYYGSNCVLDIYTHFFFDFYQQPHEDYPYFTAE